MPPEQVRGFPPYGSRPGRRATRERVSRLLLACLVLSVLATGQAHAQAGATDAIARKAALCSACHGASGVPINKEIPVIWGQHAGYIFIELRDFQSSARKNDIMAPIVKGLSSADMLALGEYFEGKPWPDLSQPRAPADVTAKAEGIAASGQCTQCHLSGYLGASTTPRLAGQSIEYLRHTMEDFHTGSRGNNPWMAALLKTFPNGDINALAVYLGGL
jgi:cytochrome c553